MADKMMFPNTIKEFIDGYSFKDSDEVYTNGVELIPVFRVEQALEHYEQESRAKVIDELVEETMKKFTEYELTESIHTVTGCKMLLRDVVEKLKEGDK